MRWLANILFVFMALIAIFFLVNQEIDYEFIGRTVLEPNLQNQSCGTTLYQNLWNSVLKTISEGGRVPVFSNAIGAGSNEATSLGKCTNFDVYNVTFDSNGNMTMYYIYMTHSGENPRITAGMLFIDNSDGGFSLPSSPGARKSALYGQIPARSKYMRGDGAVKSNPNPEVVRYLKFPYALPDPVSGGWKYPADSDTDQNAFITVFNSTIVGDYNNSNTIYVHRDYNITFVVYQSDRLPFLSKKNFVIPNFILNEDVNKPNAFSLKDVFDWSGNVDFTFYTNRSNSAGFEIDSGFNVTIKPVQNWHGNIKANVSAKSSNGTELFSNNFNVIVNSINDAPVHLQQFNSEYIWHFNQNKTFDISDYFSDPDGDAMNFSATQMSHIRTLFTSSKIIFTPEANWQGSEKVIITANDSVLSISSRNITLTVKDLIGDFDGNTAPRIENRNPVSSSVTLVQGDSQEFIVTASDLENDALTYEWSVNGALAQSTTNRYLFLANQVGSFNIKVVVSDGVLSQSAQWSVVVGGSDGADRGTEREESTVTIDVRKDSGAMKKIIFLIAGVIVILGLIVVAVVVLLRMSKKKGGKVTVVKGSDKSSGYQARQQKKSFFETLKYDELTSVVNFIKTYKSRGVPDREIREVLLKRGWKAEQVNEAFKRANY